MCLWVFNVSDRSVTDIVRGSWEQWAYLRYFDAPTNMVNVCRATGVRASESSLLFCSSCEDQYLPASIGVSHTASLRKSWLCDRCKAGGGEISSLAVTKAYSIEELGQPLLARASELGTGWFKTVAANSGPTERSCVVSPSGMKCDQHIPSEYEKLKKVEATRHDSLIKVRQLEFNKELKLGHRLDRGSRLKLNASTASAPSMSLGVLATLSSDMATFTWSIAAAPSSSTSSSSLTAHAQIHVDVRSIPPFGYFGLSEEQIKGRIEGLRFSGNCPSYLFAEAGNIRNSFISELTKSRDARRIRKQCEERANDYIANERWFWELKLLKNSSMLERKRGAVVQESLSPDLYDNMANLFPEEFSSEEAETLLSTWDFLSSARPFLPELGIGFSELIRSLQQVSNPLLPSAPQVIFDEVCMALTALLLEDIRRRAASLDASVWHEVLWAKPVNIISWPTVAYQTCIALLQERYFGKSMSPTTLKDLLNASPNGDDAIRLQLFTLLVSHPFVPELVNFAKLKSSASFSVQSIQRKCLASIAGKEEAYTSMATFISDVECLWEDIYSAYSSGSIEYSAAELVRKWFVSLLTKLNISLADGMYSPHMRQHEQQHDSEVSHPSTWTDAQSIPIHALKLASSSVVNSFDDIKFSSGFGPFYGATPRLAPNCGAGEGVTANSNELSGHPACFGTHATFVGDHLLCIASLIHIETTLTTLLASNSDYWSRRERIDVLAVLVDLAASSSQYRELLASATDVKIAAGLPNKTALQARAPPNAPLTKTQRVASKDISDVPPSPRQLVEIMEDFVVPKVPESQSQMRCFFSGTDIAHSKGEPWVYVPRYLLRTPLGEKIPTDRDRPIALKNLTLRIAAAREIAENEHRTSMVYCCNIVQIIIIHDN